MLKREPSRRRSSSGELQDHEKLIQRELPDPEFRAAFEDTVARTSLFRRFILLRRKRGMSQAELARRSKTAQSAISDFEKGTSEPRISTLQRYAREMGCRLEFQLWEGPFMLFNSWIHRSLPYESVVEAVRVDEEIANAYRSSLANAEGERLQMHPDRVAVQQMDLTVCSYDDEGLRTKNDPYLKRVANEMGAANK